MAKPVPASPSGKRPGSKGAKRSRNEAVAPAPSWLATHWLKLALVLGVVLVLGGGGTYTYRSLEAMYPQEFWKYYRPAPPAASGSVLYRNADGELYLAPVAGNATGQRLADRSLPATTHELIRDAAVLPDGKQVAYYATERATTGQSERDRIKIMTLDGTIRRVLAVESVGEVVRPVLYVSATGRYLAVTSRDRTRAYFADLNADQPLVPGQADAPPERMLWTKNGDLREAPLPSLRPAAVTVDGQLRAQVRAGTRRAPACDEAECQPAQELIVGSATVAGAAQPPVVLFGVFSDFAADGWGPVPAQPAFRLFGRLIWSPDSHHLLFNTVDGADVRVYIIGAGGQTAPRLLREGVEALDWIP